MYSTDSTPLRSLPSFQDPGRHPCGVWYTICLLYTSAFAEGSAETLPEKPLKIEVIGDSITCGYGVDDEDENHQFTTATEDVTKAYAYKTAKALDAEYSICLLYTSRCV